MAMGLSGIVLYCIYYPCNNWLNIFLDIKTVQSGLAQYSMTLLGSCSPALQSVQHWAPSTMLIQYGLSDCCRIPPSIPVPVAVHCPTDGASISHWPSSPTLSIPGKLCCKVRMTFLPSALVEMRFYIVLCVCWQILHMPLIIDNIKSIPRALLTNVRDIRCKSCQFTTYKDRWIWFPCEYIFTFSLHLINMPESIIRIYCV